MSASLVNPGSAGERIALMLSTMGDVIKLVCGHRGVHRPVTVFAYAGPLPVPPDYTPRTPGSVLDLNCPHCGFAPRPGDAGLRALLGIAMTRPAMTLDINPGPTSGKRARPASTPGPRAGTAACNEAGGLSGP